MTPNKIALMLHAHGVEFDYRVSMAGYEACRSHYIALSNEEYFKRSKYNEVFQPEILVGDIYVVPFDKGTGQEITDPNLYINKGCLPATVQWFVDIEGGKLSTQLGCHLEEIAEMLATLDEQNMSTQMFALANEYKQGKQLNDYDEVQLLDDLCDQSFTAVGVATLAGMDFIGAYKEVVRSNDSKRDVNGNFVYDTNGKVIKPSHYSTPDLKPFVNHELFKVKELAKLLDMTVEVVDGKFILTKLN